MNPIDLIFRFDPAQPMPKGPPADADAARRLLEEGNRRYARWTDSCLQAHEKNQDIPSLITPCSLADLGLPTAEGLAAKQAPFAVLFGCSDARVPAEILFGQLRNNLFVVRVAGNVLSDECLGSIEYAVHNLAESIRIIVVLGHTGCGAVAATVDTYLKPWDYLAKVPSPALRSIVDRLFVPVRKAANALENIWGPDAAQRPGYRDALHETAVAVNALQSAYHLRQELEREGKKEIKVVYGIFDLVTHRVWTAPRANSRATLREAILADAPATLAKFEELAGRIAARAARRTDSESLGRLSS
jgi:carbonic anhydrase